jgi:glycosyltransferase involved in cell wall biosynthesis
VSERNVELGSRARIQVRRIFYRLTACTVVNTEATKKALVSRGLEPRRGISIVHNAVALPSEELAVRSFEPPDNRPFEWITVGRLVAQKDYPSLLAALKLLGEQGVAVRLTIVGRGADEPMLKRLSVSLGVGDSVTWLGERSDVTELLPQYDGFVLASAWEGLPNALLEAAVVGLPAVVTDVGGSSEVFPEEQRSTLVPAGEPNRLATRMRQVVEQPAAVRNREARERQDYVRKNFSPPSVFTKWDAVINQELARRKVDL